MPALDALALEFESAGVRSAFIYTREAHPGDSWLHHSSFEDKVGAARRFVVESGVQRPVLVDTLDGDVHRAYGTLPNMSWIVSRSGTILYKADWTDPRTIRQALQQIGFQVDERRSGVNMAPYYIESLPQRPNSSEEFMRGLIDVGGPRSAHEFLDAIAARSGGEQAVASMRAQVKEMISLGKTTSEQV